MSDEAKGAKAKRPPRQKMPEQAAEARIRNFDEVPFGLTAEACYACNHNMSPAVQQAHGRDAGTVPPTCGRPVCSEGCGAASRAA